MSTFNLYKIIARTSANHPLIKKFISKHHYIGTLSRGNQYVYCLGIGNKLVGVAIYGTPVGTYCSQKYGNVIELKRFALSPECPKNTGSWFLAKCHKLLPKGLSVLSYCDPSAGHEGTLYRAANFMYLGKQKHPSFMIKVKGEKKLYPASVMYRSKKTGARLKLLKQQGLAKQVTAPSKHIFIYKRT